MRANGYGNSIFSPTCKLLVLQYLENEQCARTAIRCVTLGHDARSIAREASAAPAASFKSHYRTTAEAFSRIRRSTTRLRSLVFLTDAAAIYTYNFQTNTYARITPAQGFVTSIYLSGAIDPTRKLFVLVGGCPFGTCGPGDDGTSNPGFTFDSVANDFVGWPNQGNPIYILTPDPANQRLTCQKQTFPGGPPNSARTATGANSSNGTFGRLRYFPGPDVFVLVNDLTIPAYVLRLR